MTYSYYVVVDQFTKIRRFLSNKTAHEPSHIFKGIYLSKALTCMKFFWYEQKCFFIKETDTFGHIVV